MKVEIFWDGSVDTEKVKLERFGISAKKKSQTRVILTEKKRYENSRLRLKVKGKQDFMIHSKNILQVMYERENWKEEVEVHVSKVAI